MVHLFEKRGRRFLLDVPSGALHELTDVAYRLAEITGAPLESEAVPAEILDKLTAEGFTKEDITDAYDDLRELQAQGTLYSEDVKYPIIDSGIVKSICLNIAHDCNLRCKYCFASTGDYDHSRELMSLDTAKAAIDFLLEKSAGIKHLELDFFGGEPLMNWDTVKKAVEYGRMREKEYGKEIAFTLTTNGTLLDDEKIDFINEHISNVVLSIDGRRCVNDNVRTFLDGSGCYDDILPKYKKLVAGRGDKDWFVRGTFTRQNLDFASDVISLADEGFNSISIEPVVLDASDPLSLREEDVPAICKEYERLADELVKRRDEGRPVNFFHFVVELDAGPCVYKRIKGCGSGSEYVAITPNGDIYPCHQFVGVDEYRMGSVLDGSFDKTIRKRFANNNIMTNPECEKCWAKYFCGGGCAANNCKFNGCPEKPYNITCELERARLECAFSTM